MSTNSIQQWAVGITAAPRPNGPILPRTMQSLVDAGWPGAVLYCEPDTHVPDYDPDAWTVIYRPERFGAWKNWLLALADLVERFPHADAVMLCQDDVVFCRGLRAYLEKTLWPGADPATIGLCSPYCPAPFQNNQRGWRQINQGDHLLGALCWVFPRATAATIARDWMPEADKHRQHIDPRIGHWCKHTSRRVYYHSPSLAQHVGNGNSALGDGTSNWMRRAHDFVGENSYPDGRPPAPKTVATAADLEVPTQHVVITRFNLGLWDWKTCERERAGWMQHRQHLFLTCSLASMQRQMDRDWFWFVAMDDRTRPEYLRWVDDQIGDLPGGVFAMKCTARFVAPKFLGALSTAVHDDTELLITTRLDTDDAVVPDFTRRIRAMANPAGDLPQLLDFPNGYQLELGKRRFRRLRQPRGGTRFASIVERRPPGNEWKSVLMDVHHRLPNLVASAVYDETPAWCGTIHRTNTNSKPGGPIVDAPEFAWLLKEP